MYRIGNTTYQEEYDELTGRLFATLDELERRLGGRRFLFGDAITEADIRLWVTLARFDAAYYGLFKVNLRRLTDYPNLWGYARDLYQRPAFRETTDFGAIKTAYYGGFARLNPARIIPAGPDIDWEAPHGRDRLARPPRPGCPSGQPAGRASPLRRLPGSLPSGLIRREVTAGRAASRGR